MPDVKAQHLTLVWHVSLAEDIVQEICSRLIMNKEIIMAGRDCCQARPGIQVQRQAYPGRKSKASAHHMDVTHVPNLGVVLEVSRPHCRHFAVQVQLLAQICTALHHLTMRSESTTQAPARTCMSDQACRIFFHKSIQEQSGAVSIRKNIPEPVHVRP